MQHLSRGHRGWRTAVLLAAVTVAAVASLALRPEPDAAATWWPAAALSTMAVATSPRRWWPALVVAVCLATGAANLVGGRPGDVSLVLGLANAAEALVAALLLRGGREEVPPLLDPGGFFRLLLAGAAGALTVAVVAEVGLATLGAPLGRVGAQLLPSHLAASLIVLPLLLLPRRGPRCPRRSGELAAQSGLLVGALLVAVMTSHTVAALLAMLPLVTWAALRARPLVTAAQVTVVAAVTTLGTATGTGGIARVFTSLAADELQAGANVQAFLVCLALLGVPTALAAEQRRTLIARLDSEHRLSSATLAMTAALIVVTDVDGVVQRVNDTVERLTGFSPADLLGCRIWETGLIPPERRQTTREIWSDPGGGSVPTLREAEVATLAGDRLHVVWNNNVVRTPDGEVAHVVCTATDVTSERTTKQLVEHLFGSPKAAPMLFLDEDLRVTLGNVAVAQLFGTELDDVVGAPFTRLVCPEQHADMSAALDRAGTTSRQTRSAAELEHPWSFQRPDGSVVRLHATVSAVVDARRRQIGTLVVANDAGRQLAQEEALQRALETERHAVERLQRLDEAKNDFVSTVSHELRTPTTSIVGYTEMLRDEVAGSVNDRQRDLLDVIARNGARLIAVANDLLTLAGLEAREEAPGSSAPTGDHTGIDLGSVVTHAQEAVAPLVADRVLALDFEVPDGPVVVAGDAGHLDRVVVNLLSNAVKFTPDGGTVRCRLAILGSEAVLRVSDTGIGIPRDEQTDLFTKFFRSSTAQHRAIPGTGLGLSIIHRIVEDHGGRITVTSEAGEGATFTVRLPLAPVAGSVAAQPLLSAG